MELTGAERKCNKALTKLYYKYGDNIPNDELQKVNGTIDITAQRFQEIAKYSRYNAQKIAFVVSAVQKSDNVRLHQLVKEPKDINIWKVIFWLFIGLLTIFFGIGFIIIIAELIIVIMHKRKLKHWTEFTLQETVYAPEKINKWKVAFWYAMGLVTILLFGIGIIVIIWETIAIWEHVRKQKRFAYIKEIEAIVAVQKAQNTDTSPLLCDAPITSDKDFEQPKTEEPYNYMEQNEETKETGDQEVANEYNTNIIEEKQSFL